MITMGINGALLQELLNRLELCEGAFARKNEKYKTAQETAQKLPRKC